MKYTSRCRAHYAYSHFRAQPQSRCSNYNRATRAAERSARSTAPLTLGLPCLDPNGSPMSVRSSDPNTNYDGIWEVGPAPGLWPGPEVGICKVGPGSGLLLKVGPASGFSLILISKGFHFFCERCVWKIFLLINHLLYSLREGHLSERVILRKQH